MKVKNYMAAILGTVMGIIGGAIVVGKTVEKNTGKWKEMSDKHLTLFLLMNEWMKKKQEGKELKSYFEKNNYNSIAVYGLSYVGERVLDELEQSGIEVKYAIDKKAETIYSDVTVYSPNDELMEVDAVVVTAVSFYDEIRDALSERLECPIISFEDILYEI